MLFATMIEAAQDPMTVWSSLGAALAALVFGFVNVTAIRKNSVALSKQSGLHTALKDRVELLKSERDECLARFQAMEARLGRQEEHLSQSISEQHRLLVENLALHHRLQHEKKG